MADRKKHTLGTQVLIGVLAGILVGILLGDYATPLDYVGKAYVALLQMTVLPYITVSLISKIGGLAPDKLKVLAGQAGLIMLALWVVSLATVFLIPLSLPTWEAGRFFSTTLVERPAPVDFLDLYLPKNPFNALANNVVPAVVVFSIFVGVAVIFTPRKKSLLELSQAISDVLGEVSNFVIKISPWGTFALTAAAAGTLSPGELMRLAGYVSSFTFATILLSLVVLPALTAAVTPYRYSEILSALRNSILTAFATGKLFAVLPVVMQDVKSMLIDQGLSAEDAEEDANLYVPIAYPFPNAGKIIGLLFIPFAAWYVGSPMKPEQYLSLLPAGLFAFFGSPIAAIPFLLDMLRLPTDLLPLFLVAGIWCARLGDTLGAVHLGVFSVLCSSWNRGTFAPRLARLLSPMILITVFGIAVLGANHWIIKASLPTGKKPADLVAGMDLIREIAKIEQVPTGSVHTSPLQPGETRWHRIQRTRQLRVGYLPHTAPYSFENSSGKIVGFDIDLIQRLAADLEATLVLVPAQRTNLAAGFEKDSYDLAVGEIASSIEHHGRYLESRPYLETHAALLVPDHLVDRYKTLAAIRANRRMRLGVEAGGLMVRTHRFAITGIEEVVIEQAQPWLAHEFEGIDALLTTAERGSVMTILHPEFSVVIPEGIDVKIPLIVATSPSEDLREAIDTWLGLKKADGSIGDLYDHWILGKDLEKTSKTRRWCVIRDVLGWVR